MPSLHFQDHSNSQSRDSGSQLSFLSPLQGCFFVNPTGSPSPMRGFPRPGPRVGETGEERAAWALLQVGLLCINKGQADKRGEWEDLASSR